MTMNNTGNSKNPFLSGCEINCAITLDFTADGDMKVFSPIFRESIEKPEGLLNSFRCENSGELIYRLDMIADLARTRGALPILAFDGHGTDRGLDFGIQKYDEKLSERLNKVEFLDIYPWAELLKKLQAINIACSNNLIVLFATCNSAKLFEEKMEITRPAPFYFCVAPRRNILAGELKTAYEKFCTDFHNKGSFDLAANGLDSDLFAVFFPEQIFCLVVTGLSKHLHGKEKRQWGEDSLTNFRWNHPDVLHLPNSNFRSAFDQSTRDRNGMIQQFKNSFLMANHPSNSGRFAYTYEEICRMVSNGKIPR